VNLMPTPGHKSHTAFRVAALAALIAAVSQVTLGGVVRVTGSGLGCPDWPLCHGRLVPTLEFDTLIEYSHRLSAVVLGVLVLATTVMAWRAYRADRRVTVVSTLALALVVVAAALGWATVGSELAWGPRLLHLGVAELLVACMVVVSVTGWGGRDSTAADGLSFRGPDWFKVLVASTIVGAFALILLGSYMVGQGYGSSCATWPLCRGSVLPQGDAYMIHMAHRIAAALVGVLIAAMTVSAWSRRAWRPELLWASLIALGLFVVQSLVGAVTVWAGFSTALRALHLSMATLLWVSLVFTAALTFVRRRFELRGAEGSRERVPELERVAL